MGIPQLWAAGIPVQAPRIAGGLRTPRVPVGEIIPSLLPCPGGSGVWTGDASSAVAAGGFPVPSCGHSGHQGGEDEDATVSPSLHPCRVGICPRGCPSARVASGPGRDGRFSSLLSHCPCVNQGSPGMSRQLGVPVQGLELDLAQLHPRGCLGIPCFQKGLVMPGFPVPADAFCSSPRGG